MSVKNQSIIYRFFFPNLFRVKSYWIGLGCFALWYRSTHQKNLLHVEKCPPLFSLSQHYINDSAELYFALAKQGIYFHLCSDHCHFLCASSSQRVWKLFILDYHFFHSTKQNFLGEGGGETSGLKFLKSLFRF